MEHRRAECLLILFVLKASAANDCNMTAPSLMNQSAKDKCCKEKGVGCKEEHAARATEPFDCSVGHANHLSKWSMTKRLWCCQYTGSGCPSKINRSRFSTTVLPSAIPEPTAAYASPGCDTMCSYEGKSASCGFRMQWAATHRFLHQPQACKQSYAFVLQECPNCNVCPISGSGCTDQVPPACDTICEYEEKSASCKFRIQWATDHRYLGQSHACESAHSFVLQQCPSCSECTLSAARCQAQAIAPADVATSEKFDCHTEEVDMWPSVHRSWCCHHKGIGCDEPNTRMKYNCEAGYTHWQLGWSIPKKEWCCEHMNLGCPPSTSVKRSHDSTTKDKSYDCDVGYSNWEVGWAEGKKLWCCKNRERGCPPPPAPAAPAPAEPVQESSLPYDCSTGFAHWQFGWSPTKKKWCCKHQGRGCRQPATTPMITSSDPYDCNKDYDYWKKEWSSKKTHWCCKHRGLGCLPAPSPSSEVADKPISGKFNQPAQRQPYLEPRWHMEITPAFAMCLLVGCLGLGVSLVVFRRRLRHAEPMQTYTELTLLETDSTSSCE